MAACTRKRSPLKITDRRPSLNTVSTLPTLSLIYKAKQRNHVEIPKVRTASSTTGSKTGVNTSVDQNRKVTRLLWKKSAENTAVTDYESSSCTPNGMSAKEQSNYAAQCFNALCVALQGFCKRTNTHIVCTKCQVCRQKLVATNVAHTEN